MFGDYVSGIENGADRSNRDLNYEIERQIWLWDGTVHGQTIERMYNNGSDYESICEAAGIDYQEWEN